MYVSCLNVPTVVVFQCYTNTGTYKYVRIYTYLHTVKLLSVLEILVEFTSSRMYVRTVHTELIIKVVNLGSYSEYNQTSF